MAAKTCDPISASDPELLEAGRRRLLRDLQRVAPAAVGRALVPRARTIAESLLHLAAVELVFATALAARAGGTADPDLWERVKAGLATEVGYASPRDATLDGCIARLGDVRARLEPVLEGRPVVRADELRDALERLREAGADLDRARIDALHPKLASHLDGGSVGVVLLAHEEYHRGQILLQHWLLDRVVAR